MADSKTLQDLKMLNEWSDMAERVEILERKIAHQNVLINKLYSLDVIQNYTKYKIDKN